VSALIRLFVFEDRVGLISPGHLPNNLTIANIRSGNSNIRNPILASFATKILPYRGLGSEKANAEFISAYLNSKHGKEVLYSMAKNIVGMANINAEELKSINIFMPPLVLQTQFAQIVAQVEQHKQRLETSLAEMEQNFNSLMQRAFRGEL
jgi:type I restriction enzyme S subunit